MVLSALFTSASAEFKLVEDIAIPIYTPQTQTRRAAESTIKIFILYYDLKTNRPGVELEVASERGCFFDKTPKRTTPNDTVFVIYTERQ